MERENRIEGVLTHF